MSRDETRASLILRVRDSHDQSAWSDFAHIYMPIIAAYARRCGVPRHEVDDLVQEVMAAVLQLIKRFSYDPSRGKFRSWLRSVTHRRILKWRSGRRRTPVQAEDSRLFQNVGIEDVELEGYWDRQWRRHILSHAMLRACKNFDPQTIEAFRRYVMEQEPAAEVAAALGMTVSNVYVCKSRVLDRLRQELEVLDGG